jgi:LmbE family N-acetylglucosaminyl deacetylase
MNVLVIAPHPDDECIGCGGTICRHVERGDKVSAVFLTSGELGLKHLAKEEAWRIREKEARRAGKILGLAELHFLRRRDWFLSEEVEPAAADLAPILERLKPELIYLPHENEWHPDHKASLSIVRAVLVHGKIPAPQLRAYEVWTPLSEFDHVENISEMMPQKLKALRCHRSQLGEFDYAGAIRGLNQYRGVLAGKCKYAEVFSAASS